MDNPGSMPKQGVNRPRPSDARAGRLRTDYVDAKRGAREGHLRRLALADKSLYDRHTSQAESKDAKQGPSLEEEPLKAKAAGLAGSVPDPTDTSSNESSHGRYETKQGPNLEPESVAAVPVPARAPSDESEAKRGACESEPLRAPVPSKAAGSIPYRHACQAESKDAKQVSCLEEEPLKAKRAGPARSAPVPTDTSSNESSHGRHKCQAESQDAKQGGSNLELCLACEPGQTTTTNGSRACISKRCNFYIEYLDMSKGKSFDDWECLPCPEGGFCEGDNVVKADIMARQGFWRVPGTISFEECLVTNACVGAGGEATEKTANGTERALEHCNEDIGYKENCTNYGTGKPERCRLCAACASGFKRVGSRGECVPCPEEGLGVALIPIGISGLILAMVGLIAVTIKSGGGTDDSISDIIKKVAINYAQLVSLASQFPLEWPPAIQNMFLALNTVSSGSGDLLSPACVLSYDTGKTNAEIFYFGSITASLIPIIAVGLSSAVWKAIYSVRKRSTKYSVTEADCAVLSNVLILFVLYPSLVRSCMSFLACQNVGGKLYLGADLQEPCFEGRHLQYVLVLCATQIVLYVLGLPLVAFFVLWRKRKKLHDPKVLFRYGLLFNGYRKEKYWWEGVIAMRKVLVVLLGVLGALTEPNQQVFLALMLVFSFLVVHLAQLPFEKSMKESIKGHAVLHKMESMSLCVAFVTFWGGLMFYSNESDAVKVAVSIFLIVCNSAFVMWLFIWFLVAYRQDAKRKKKARKSLMIVPTSPEPAVEDTLLKTPPQRIKNWGET
eukprot:g435.t1